MLDCACGIGYGSFYVASKTGVKQVLAVDINKDAVHFAKRHYKHENIKYLRQGVFSLDENQYTESIKLIIILKTQEHLDAPRRLQQFHRCLKPGGLIIASTPNEIRLPFNQELFPYHLRHYLPDEFDDLWSSFLFQIIGRFTQHDQYSGDVVEGWDCLYNIVMARKK